MSFIYIDRIEKINNSCIVGHSKPFTNEYWEYIESAAQLCSFHTRWLLNFSAHSFLLKISKFELYKTINKQVELIAQIVGTAPNSYKFKVTGMYNYETVLMGTILIGTISYGTHFSKNKISSHYKKVIKCLIKE